MGAVLASAYQNRGLTHSVTLMPLIDGMLRTAGLSLDDIGLIAAANGPGSFTGLRIGVSAAKGLAWAKELPCCGVSTLAAMARTAADFQGLIIGAMDARRQQIYHALFRGENGRVLRVTQDCAISLEELASLLRDMPEEKLVVGDGAALCADYLSTAGISCRMADEHHRMQSARGRGAVRGGDGGTGRDSNGPASGAGVPAAQSGGAGAAVPRAEDHAGLTFYCVPCKILHTRRRQPCLARKCTS